MVKRPSRRPGMTAEELVAALEKDPEYQARLAEVDRDRHERTRIHRLVSRPILDDLRKVGIDVGSLDELRRSGKKYEEAIPILVPWLKRIENNGVLESIVRT